MTNLIEQIAAQWDGCMYEGVGGDIDIGQAIRDAGKDLAKEAGAAAAAAEPHHVIGYTWTQADGKHRSIGAAPHPTNAHNIEPIYYPLAATQPNAAPAAGVVARYSFVCNAGCGVCGVKVRPFEYERTETLEGEHLGSKYQPQIVSSCCGAEVHVYDNQEDHWGAEVTLAAPGAAIDTREQETALPPMTCKHSNRSDCALFGSEETPVKFQRPSREWYASKIQETLDDDFLIGAQAPSDIPPPSAADRGLTKAERQMMAYLFSNMGHLTDAEWRQHGFRRATFDRLEKKLSDYRPAPASRSEAPATRPNAAGQEQGWISVDERLPEPDVAFLAHCQCGGESSGVYTMRLPVLIDKNSRPDGVFNRERVTHWMPLPLPPLEAVGSSGMTADKEGVQPGERGEG